MVFRWRSLCCLLRHATWLLRSVPLLPSLVYSPLYVACGMTESHRAHHVRCTGGVQVLALITMMGWKLGMIESVSLTILAGFSVDFCVRGFHGALLGIPKRVLSVDHSRFIWLTLITQAVSLHGALACCGCKCDVQCCHGLIRATAGLPRTELAKRAKRSPTWGYRSCPAW